MSMLSVRIPAARGPRLAGLSAIAAFFASVNEIVAEAWQMSRDAHKRYPFAEW